MAADCNLGSNIVNCILIDNIAHLPAQGGKKTNKTTTETFGCEGQGADAYREWALLREAFVKSIAMGKSVFVSRRPLLLCGEDLYKMNVYVCG